MIVSTRLKALLCSLIVGQAVRAQDNRSPDPNNQFIYPGLPGPQSSNDPTVFQSDLNFTVGQTLDIPWKWLTNMTNYRTVMIQEAPPTEYKELTLQDCGNNPQFIYWNGSIGSINLTISSIAYIAVCNCSDSPSDLELNPIFFSHYFNLVEANSSTTTTTTTASATPSQTNGPASSSHAADKKSQKSTNSAAIGAGIGGAVGGALIVLGLVAFIWRTRGKRTVKQQADIDANDKFLSTDRQHVSPTPLSTDPSITQHQQQYHHRSYQPPSELNGTTDTTQ